MRSSATSDVYKRQERGAHRRGHRAPAVHDPPGRPHRRARGRGRRGDRLARRALCGGRHLPALLGRPGGHRPVEVDVRDEAVQRMKALRGSGPSMRST